MSSTQLTDPPISSSSQPHPAQPEPEGGKGSVIRKVVVVLVIAGAVGGTIWKIRSNAATQTTTNQRSAQAADRPQPVLVAAVEQKTMPIYLTALGTVTPYYSVTIKSRVDGQLLSVAVREGQAVRKGQLLAEIDPAPYEAAVAQAEGQLAKDTAAANYAKVEAQRYKDLYEAGVVSKDSAQTQESTAGQSAGAIEADKAAIQAAKVNLAYTKIYSPIEGVVGLRQVDPGNIVHASDATGLLLVTQLQPISVIFTLPEDQLPQVLQLVRKGNKLPVELYDRSQALHLASGTLLTLDNQIDPTTGTDKVKAISPNKDGALFPNQFVNVRLILQQRPNAIVVPAAAIQTGSQGNFVFVVKPGMPPGGGARAGGGGRRGAGGGAGGGQGATAPAAGNAPATAGGAASGAPQAGGQGQGAGGGRGGNAKPFYVVTQPVKVDVTEGTQVILASGVNPGDQVVVDGQEKLLNLSRVTPRTQDQLAGGAGGGNGRKGAQPDAGDASAAFGPGGAGPSEPSSNPHKRGIEDGHGVPAGAAGDAQPDAGQHHHQGGARTGQQQ